MKTIKAKAIMQEGTDMFYNINFLDGSIWLQPLPDTITSKRTLQELKTACESSGIGFPEDAKLINITITFKP